MIDQNLKTAYDNFYTQNDIAWRMMGARYKAQHIVDVCKGLAPKKVLEVGAGDGSILHFLNEWNFAPELYALEIAESGVNIIKERNLKSMKEAKTFSGYEIPYEDNAFDLVILAHVLEHVEHERILLRELKRVARHLIIEVPKDYRYGVDKRIKHFLAYGHINMYTPTSLRFLLLSEGFEIIRDQVSLTSPETVKFNEFKNRKVRRTFAKVLKIELEYHIKKALGKLLGRKKEEQYANAYTILVTKLDHNLNIF